MKILAFVDMHGSKTALQHIKEKSKHADLLVCAGDLTQFERNLKSYLYELDKLGKPIVMIPGNHESPVVLEKACRFFKNFLYIHESLCQVDDYVFLGHGGGGFAIEDNGFEKFSQHIMPKIDSKKTLVMVVHAPPYKTKLDQVGQDHVGNNAYRNFIIKHQPKLVICGHIHENSGKEDTLGKTLIINPGPSGKLLDI